MAADTELPFTAAVPAKGATSEITPASRPADAQKATSPKPRESQPVESKAKAPEVAPEPAPTKVEAAKATTTKPATVKPVAASPAPAAKAAKPVAAQAVAKPVAPSAPGPVKAPAKAVKKPITSTQAAPAPRPLPQTKDKTMASQAFDFIAPFKTAFADMQEKAKEAYEKGTASLTEANDFAKGNVEAIVESSKILASGLQELGATALTDSKAVFETMTTEIKSLASAKSPTEFFQLQSALLRKHFDTAVAQTSKSTEAVLKLANDSVAPLSNRVTLAVEKVSKVA